MKHIVDREALLKAIYSTELSFKGTENQIMQRFSAVFDMSTLSQNQQMRNKFRSISVAAINSSVFH